MLEFFKKKPEIQRVVIYGSRAKGTYKNGSDIDFAIWSDKRIASEIAVELDELQTPYMFDVADYKALSHENLKKVLIVMVLFFINEIEILFDSWILLSSLVGCK